MKRYATIIFSFTCATNLLFAQQDVWTIDKCMRYAVEHNFDVRANAISLDNSHSDYRQAVASFFPTIGASISADYSFGRSIDPSTNSYNNLKTFNNSYSLSASWTIFAGGQIVNQFRQAKKQREQSTEKLQNAKDETALKVMEAYVNLQYYRALSGITASKLEESRALLGKSRRMKELGMNSAIEVSQAEAQYAEDDYTHTATLGQLQTAELSLKNAMNFPISDTLRLPDPSTELLPFEAAETNFNEIIDFARENNPLARQARLNVEISRDAVRQAKGALSPSISLQAGLSDSYYRHIGSANNSFRTQMNGNFGQYVGVSMSIPLFNGLSRHTTLQKAKNSELNAQLEYNRNLYQLDIDIRQAIVDCDNLVKELDKMERKTKSDSIAYRLARKKYEEGLMSFLDMQETANTWFESQAETVRSTLTLGIKRRLLEYYRTNIIIFE